MSRERSRQRRLPFQWLSQRTAGQVSEARAAIMFFWSCTMLPKASAISALIAAATAVSDTICGTW